jgi:hypothetical protein
MEIQGRGWRGSCYKVAYSKGMGNVNRPQKRKLYNFFSHFIDGSQKETILKGVQDWVYLFKEYPVL